MTMPPTNRALQIHEHGGPEVLKLNEVPVPQPSTGHIIIKVEWAGVNFVDNYQRSGLYPNKGGWPLTLGVEAAGTIVALPTPVPENDAAYNARAFKLGQRVAVNHPGAYTEYLSAPWAKVYPVPDDVDTRTAATVFVQALTVITEIRESYATQAGDTILVHAAAGGLGLIFCSLLNAMGVSVIGTTSTSEKAALAKAHGAAEVLLYAGPEKDDLKAHILELTGGQGVHAVFDGVGKDTWELDFKVIRRLGTIVFVGNASGPVPPFPVLKLSEKNTKVCRPTLVHSLADPIAALSYANILWAALKDGSLRVNVHKAYDFSAEGLRAAHEDIAGRGTTGKLLVKVAA